MNIIHESFKHGENFKIGSFCVIEEDVIVGDGVSLGNYVMLKKGTRFGNNVDFADGCVTTGVCYAGNNTAFRTAAVLSKSVIVEDWAFYGPGVVSNHTKHVYHGRNNMKKEQLLTVIGYGSVIGTQVSIVAGASIAPLAILGNGAIIVKDITENGVYVGNPAKKIMELPEMYKMDLPENAGKMYLTEEILNHFRKYLSNLKI